MSHREQSKRSSISRAGRLREEEPILLHRYAMYVGLSLLALFAVYLTAVLLSDQSMVIDALPPPSRLPVLKMAHYDLNPTRNSRPTQLLTAPFRSLKTWTVNKIGSYTSRRPSKLMVSNAAQTFRNVLRGAYNRVKRANRGFGGFIKSRTSAIKSIVSRVRYRNRGSKVVTSDRVEMDIHALGLTAKQKRRIHEILDAITKEGGDALREAAAESHIELTPHLVYRYLVSVDWADKYNGKKFAKAIQDTVLWRRSFGLNTTNTAAVQHPRMIELVRRGFAYVSPVPDKDGRAVVYLKVARNYRRGAIPDYLNLLLYTMERADKQSVQFHSGEFISVMDLQGLTYAQCPPVSFLKQAISLMKMHYPYRLSAVYVVNAGCTFNMLYNVIKPILPRKALAKMYVLKGDDTCAFLKDAIGAAHLETQYGGIVKEYFHPSNSTTADVHAYYDSGYWGPTKAAGVPNS